MTEYAKPDWRTILLLLGAAGGGLLALTMIPLLLAYSLSGSAFSGHQSLNGPDVLQAMVLAASLAVVAALSFPAFHNSLRSLRGAAVARGGPPRLDVWQALLLIVIWLGASWLGQAVLGAGAWKWAAPLFHALAIAAPVYLWLRLAAGGLGRASRTRTWGLFATGMWLSTGLATLAELALAIATLLAVVAYAMLNPGLLPSLQQFGHDLSAVGGLSDALTALRPWLDRPWVFVSALLVFAGITPIIEEGAKSVGIWAIGDRLALPKDGLAAGALIGAGFGLVEGLFASAAPDPFWGVTLAIRGGSSMMHIAAASVAGYGIIAFRRSHHVSSLLGGYLGAVALHGLWNASVVIMGFGGMHVSTGLNDSNWIGLFLIAVGAAILVALCVGTPFGLFAFNRRLQPGALLSQPQPALEPMGITSPTPPTRGDER